MKKNIFFTFIISLMLHHSLLAMEQPPANIDIKNHAQVISFVQTLLTKTFDFKGQTASDLFSFSDYLDATTLYRVPFNTLGIAIDQIVALPIINSPLQKQISTLYNQYPTRCEELKIALRNLYQNISEEGLYTEAIVSFKAYYDQKDLEPCNQNDRIQNLSQIQENRRVFFESIKTRNVITFNEAQHTALSKAPVASLLESINICLLLIEKKGQPIIDSPENSDDDNMPEIPQSTKKDVSAIIARLNRLKTDK